MERKEREGRGNRREKKRGRTGERWKGGREKGEGTGGRKREGGIKRERVEGEVGGGGRGRLGWRMAKGGKVRRRK